MRLLYLVVITAAGAAAQPAHKADANMNAVLWVQTSAEYAANAIQTYRAAESALRVALTDSNWTAAYEQVNTDFSKLRPAVILDLDETVFDNSAFEAALSREGAEFTTKAWDGWVKESRAGAVPGSVEFLHAAALSGVTPIYITNRKCDSSMADDPTVKVLRHLRVPLGPDSLHCQTNTGDKTERRRRVAASYRILLIIGDDFGDFTEPPKTVADRAELRRLYEKMWGTKWFVLPNPMYGSWERAVGTKVEDKWKALRP